MRSHFSAEEASNSQRGIERRNTTICVSPGIGSVEGLDFKVLPASHSPIQPSQAIVSASPPLRASHSRELPVGYPQGKSLFPAKRQATSDVIGGVYEITPDNNNKAPVLDGVVVGSGWKPHHSRSL